MAPWFLFALLSALAAAATAILAKIGVAGISSTLATALRTSVVLAFVWSLVFVQGQQRELFKVAPRTLAFLGLSGLATGVSWLAYFKALQLGDASRVAPIDKLSLVFTIGLAALVLGESLTWRLVLGVLLIAAGSLLTLTG
jgi:transporter family protein